MKLIITEKQEQLILCNLLQEEVDYSEKRLAVKKYLDDNFKHGEVTNKNNKTAPIKCYVKISQGQNPKTLDDMGLFYDVQARFRDILPEAERDEFLKDAIKKWSENKISKVGSSLI